MDFWTSLSAPWQACLEEAWTAYRQGCIPIGAVITGPQGDVLSRGRNHACDRQGGPVTGHVLAHAELNALLGLDTRLVDPHPCVLYTTTEPCPLCWGAFYMSGVRQLHYASRDPWAGSANLLGATPYLRRKPVLVCGPERADLEVILVAMQIEASLRGSNPHTPSWLDEWRAALPQGVRLGECLTSTGLLGDWCRSQLPAAEVYNLLAEKAQQMQLGCFD